MKPKPLTFFLFLYILFVIYGTIFSQNLEGVSARIDAMASVWLANDLGWAVGVPCETANFPDKMLGNLYAIPIPYVGESYGAILIVKSIGNHVRLGITLNDREQMDYAFFVRAYYYVTRVRITGSKIENELLVPSATLAFTFNKFNIGIGAFLDDFRYSKDENKKYKYATADGTDSVVVHYERNQRDKYITRKGIVLDASLNLENYYIRPSVKYGVSLIGGEEYNDFLTQLERSLQDRHAEIGVQFSAKDEDFIWSSPQKIILRTGCLFQNIFNIGEFSYGAWYHEERYQFQMAVYRDSAVLDANGNRLSEGSYSVDSLETDRRWKGLDWFINFSPVFSDNFTFIPEYDGGFGWFTAKDPDLPPDTSWFYQYHNFRLGIEKGISDFWIFDKLFFRTGIAAYLNKEERTIKNGDSTTTSSVEDIPWASYYWGSDFGRRQAKISGGIGLRKGRGQLDVSVDFLAWKGQGVISGPNAVMVTVGVDFGGGK